MNMPFGKSDHVRVIKCIAEGMKAAGKLQTYLELGISRAACWNEVAPLAKNAIAVDINNEARKHIKTKHHDFYCSTTNNFFKRLSAQEINHSKFDLVFIDAEHSHEASWEDFKNAYFHTRVGGIVCLHDTYPPNEQLLGHCKDSWKTAEIIHNNNFESVTLPFYYGVTIVRKTKKQLDWMI